MVGMPAALSSRPTEPPKSPKPTMSTGCASSGRSISRRGPCADAARGAMNRSTAIPITSSSPAAVKVSRSRARAMSRKAAGTTVRPMATVAATAPSVTSARCHPGRCSAHADAPCAPSADGATGSVAGSGNRARIGITARSWKSSTAKPFSPASVRIHPFSCIVCSTMAVEESASTSPAASPTRQLRPNSIATAAAPSAVSATCSPPSPRSAPRRRQSSAGSSSSPITKGIITTPNSAACMTSCPSLPTKPSTDGPITTPAIR